MQDIGRLDAWLATHADNRTYFEDLDEDPNRMFDDNTFEFK